jgi:hypothetical protein
MLNQPDGHRCAEGRTNAYYQFPLRIRPRVRRYLQVCNYFAQGMRLAPEAGRDNGAQGFNVFRLSFSVRDKNRI